MYDDENTNKKKEQFIYLFIFDLMACGILAPQPGFQPTPCIACAVSLTAGPPGKSQGESFKGRILVNTSILRHCRKMGAGEGDRGGKQ